MTDQQTAYCVKCREKKTMKDVEEKTTSNGRKMLAGKCTTCGGKINRFIAGGAKA
jgi:NAD-dependent SIR2 family protein deacetylase